MAQHEHTFCPRYRAKIYQRVCAWALGVMMGTLGFGAMTQAKETQHLEALGIINGSMTARNTQVDITVFLSGQPLFQATDLPETEALSALIIERTRLVSLDGNTFRIQHAFPLSDGGQGTVLLPVQVWVDGKLVTATVTEDSLGVKVVLPILAHTVTVVPAGAAQLTVPAGYRGDLTTQWRISSESPLINE